jgi:hypothetical protein
MIFVLKIKGEPFLGVGRLRAIQRSYKAKHPEQAAPGVKEKMAATYSRGIYKTTTIGKAVFDVRVRNGNGSDHSFRATINYERTSPKRRFGVL